MKIRGDNMFNKDLTIYDVNIILQALGHYNDYLEGADEKDTRTHCQGLMDEFEELQKEFRERAKNV